MPSINSMVAKRTQAAIRTLSLAAAPSFAAMALLTGLSGGTADLLCAGPSPLGGMAPMYALMSVFHLAPWLKRIRQTRTGDRR